jgi:splicing factor 3A subunit 1
MGVGGMQQYGAVGGMGAPQPQPHGGARLGAPPPHPAAAYGGGADLMGMGPSVSSPAAVRPGAGAWPGPSAGPYGAGPPGVVPGPAGMGMGPYAGAPTGGLGAGAPTGYGMGPADVGLQGGGGGGGMMVGPGGQVRYVGQGMQSGTGAGAMGGMGQANGQVHKQQQQGGAAAFDFVREHFN